MAHRLITSARAEKLTDTDSGLTWTIEVVKGGLLITAPKGYVIDPLALTLPDKNMLEINIKRN